VQGQLFAPRLDPATKTCKAGKKTNLNVGNKKTREEDGGSMEVRKATPVEWKERSDEMFTCSS